jgi:hypothetical protein
MSDLSNTADALADREAEGQKSSQLNYGFIPFWRRVYL